MAGWKVGQSGVKQVRPRGLLLVVAMVAQMAEPKAEKTVIWMAVMRAGPRVEQMVEKMDENSAGRKADR